MAHRPNLLKLVTKISLESMTYTGITYSDPEYRILDPIFSDDMVAVMMHLKLNTNRTLEEISRRADMDIDFVRDQLAKLRETGAVRVHYVDGVANYYYPIWVPGIMEGVLSNKAQCERYPDLGACFEEYTRRRIAPLVPNLGTGMSLMRVMPVETAINSNNRVASYDELSTLIENATAISVGPCSCRRSRRLMGEGCGHLEDDMCMYLNDNAKNFAELGSHRLVSKEEAYAILKRAEDNGLIHEINQADGFEEANAICNCCSCSCYSLRIGAYFRTPDTIRSNYVARVDKSSCVACGQCVENCQMNALKLGKKLCSADGEEAVELDPVPGEKFWTSKDYNKDYRTDRTDVTADGTAPCKAKCPAHIPVQGYIKLASQGKYKEALELIKTENPFPAVCGRICNKACEDACTRGSVDDPLAIDDIKKFIADQELKAGSRFVPAMLNQTGRPYENKIAVIGAGPAGLSCAYYLKIKGYPVTVFEKEKQLGGMLTLGIPEFRLEKEVVNAEIDILREMGVEFKTGVEVGRDVTLPELRRQGYEAFYLGIGASKGTPVGCKGDDLEGVWTGLDFLRDVNTGKKPEVGGQVAVVGGGNVAMDVARAAVRLGAEKVTVLYRRSEEEMPAADDEVEEAKAEGVEFKYLVSPAAIEAGADGRAAGIVLEINELGEPDAKGRRKPVPTGRTETLPVTAVISAIGQKVDLGGMDKGAGFAVNKNGTVVADAMTCQTGEPDVFAGGDVVTGPKFAIDAIAAGKEAAISIHRYVHPGQTLDIGRDHRDYKPLDVKNAAIAIDSFDAPARQRAAAPAPEKAKKTFRDLRGTFTEDQLKKETERCLGCGAVVVNENMCVGCGVCTTKCRFDAIHLEKVRDHKGTPYFKTLGHAAGHAGMRYGKLVAQTISKPFGKKAD